LEILSTFLKHGADPNDKSVQLTLQLTNAGYAQTFNPIHSLIRHRSLPSVKLILESRANVNAMTTHIGPYDTEEGRKETALHMALKMADLDMTKLLLEYKADVNVICSDYDARVSQTALHIAIKAKSQIIVKCLLFHGANPFIGATLKSQQKDQYLNYTTWQLCEENEEFLQLLNCQFNKEDYPILSRYLREILRIIFLCNLRNRWKLPQDIIFKIFTSVIRM